MIIEFTVKGVNFYAEIEDDTMRVFNAETKSPWPQVDQFSAFDLYGMYSGWDAAKYNRLRGAARDAYQRSHLKRLAESAVQMELEALESA